MSRQPAINSPVISPDVCSDPMLLAQKLNEILDVLGYPGPEVPQSFTLPESTVPALFEFPARLTTDFAGGPPETATAQPITWDGTDIGDPVVLTNTLSDPGPPGTGAFIIVKVIPDPADPTSNTFIYVISWVLPGYWPYPYTAGCGIDITDYVISVETDDLIGEGLVAGTGCSIDVNVGCGLRITDGAVEVYNEELIGDYLEAGSGCTLNVTNTTQTVVTGFQVDGTTLQVKTCELTILAKGTESGWTTIHTGTECA